MEKVMKKNIILILIVALFLSSWFGLVSVSAQDVTPTPTPTPTPTGIIKVTTKPVDGQIFIDNKYVGPGSCSEECMVGSHVISFGYVEGYEKPGDILIYLRENEIYQRIVYYIAPSPTPSPAPSPTPPAIAPIIQLYSTRTTVTSKQPGLLTISAVNVMENPVMTAETVFTVDPGIEIMGVGTPFVRSGAGQYIGKFIVLPEEQKHYTVSVRALREDISSFTVKAQTIYYFGSDIANRQMIQNTITFTVIQPTPTPASTPIPASTPTQTSNSTSTNTPTPTPTSAGFEAVFTITGLLIIAYLIRKRK